MDPEDLLEEPYNFGECWSIETTAPAYCNAWKNRSREIKVLIRKEGDHTHVHFPTALFSSREGINTDQCKIIVDLYYPLADKDSMFYISKCRSRNFMGSMQVYDHFSIKDKILQASIDYDRNWGTLTFYPVNNKIYQSDEITLSKNVYDIGILETSITIDEEPEDLVVSADEDETMGERNPVVSVFPNDINNEEFDEDGIPEGWVKLKVNIDFSCGAFASKHIYKDVIYAKNQAGTEGMIVIPPVMDLIAKVTSYSKYSLALKGFAGIFNFPDGALASDGEIIVYTPHRFDSSEHYQKMNAIIYYQGDYLNIVPNESTYQYFFGLKSEYVKQRTIGLPNGWTIRFNNLSTTPTYTSIRDYSGVLDINTLPFPASTLKRVLPLKAHTDVWDEYVFGEADCEYEMIEQGSSVILSATITMKNLLSPLKRTTSLKKDTLHISIDDLRDFYGGDFGIINSCKGKVKAYNPTSKAVEEMDASATLDGNIINIVPNGASVKQFYTEDTNTTENVGIIEMTINIKIMPESN